MTDKELKKLSRKELLEIMLRQGQRIEQLERELDDAKKELDSYKNKMCISAQSKYIVKCALETATNAVNEYLKNVAVEDEERERNERIAE